MLQRVNIPKYHSKDLTVLVLSMLPMAALLNYLLFGTPDFDHAGKLLIALFVSFMYLAVAFICCGFVAVSLRNRFPSDADVFKRILICLGIFYLISAAFISLLLFVYDATNFLGYQYREKHFITAYACFVVINTFLTFLNEGLYRFENIRSNLTETEQLKKEYMQSRLLGLKSQMNPHFLFNSLNTLSSLIQEDADEAEHFLNHMSKVYRYLLRNRDEQLVSLETELNFIDSYHFILRSRHGEGLQLQINVPEEKRSEMIPPLTLQMIMENCVNQNAVSRSTPLNIIIQTENEKLTVKNSLHPKMHAVADNKDVLDNINNKYRLLCGCEMRLHETDAERKIELPLLSKQPLLIA